MTVISAITYLAAAVTSTGGHVKTWPYFAGWLFVVLTQFMTHFLGEVADAPSDRLNRYSTRITGGSKVLPLNEASERLANVMGYVCASLAFIVLHTVVDPGARAIGRVIQVMAWAYSSNPVKLNHRYCGEIDASVVTNILLPAFAAACQSQSLWDARLAALVVPPFLVKISLFLLLNLADRRPDWATRKRTLAVALGDSRSAILHATLMGTAYAVAVAIAVFHRTPLLLLFVLPSLPYGARISLALLRGVPYRLSALLGPALLHSTLLVWGVLTHELLTSPSRQLRFYHAIAAFFLYITVVNTRKGRRRAAAARAAAITAKQKEKVLLKAIQRRNPPTDISDVTTESGSASDTEPIVSSRPTHVYADVVIVGSGCTALAAAAALVKLGLDVLVVEHARKHPRFPTRSANALRALGVPKRADPVATLRSLVDDALIVSDAPVHRVIEDEHRERVVVFHAFGHVIARVAIACDDDSQSVLRNHVKQHASSHWSSSRIAVVDPYNFIDTIALATLLCQYWHEPDGHLEAFYRYERIRRPAAYPLFTALRLAPQILADNAVLARFRALAKN